MAGRDGLPDRLTPGEGESVPKSRGSHRGMTKMDRLVTGGDKPEAGGTIEADNKERTRKGGQAGQCRPGGQANSSRARWTQYEDKGTEVTGVLSWPLRSGLPICGRGVASLVQPSRHQASPPEHRLI